MNVGKIEQLSDGLPPELAIRIQPEKFVIELATETNKNHDRIGKLESRICELERQLDALVKRLEETEYNQWEHSNANGWEL